MQILRDYNLTQQIVIHEDWKPVRVERNRWMKIFQGQLLAWVGNCLLFGKLSSFLPSNSLN
jgi:hypothetical protein